MTVINLNGYSKDLRLILFFLLSLLLSYNVPAPSQIYSSVPCSTPPVLSSSVITIFSVFRFSPFSALSDGGAGSSAKVPDCPGRASISSARCSFRGGVSHSRSSCAGRMQFKIIIVEIKLESILGVRM